MMDLQTMQAEMLKAADYIDRLEEDNRQLTEAFEGMAKEAEARTMALTMIEQGAIEPEDMEGKVAEFMEATPEDLEITRRAVELYGGAPEGFAKVASDLDGSGNFVGNAEAREEARRAKFYEGMTA